MSGEREWGSRRVWDEKPDLVTRKSAELDRGTGRVAEPAVLLLTVSEPIRTEP